MGLASSGGIAEEDKREIVEQKDLVDTTFFIERIGKAFKDKKFNYLKLPVDVTLEGGEERVWFARGTAVVNQLTDPETSAPFTAALELQQGEDETKNPYYVLLEIVTETE